MVYCYNSTPKQTETFTFCKFKFPILFEVAMCPPIFLSLPHPDMTIWHSCSQWFINRWLVEITEKFNFLVSVKSFPIVSFYLYRKVDITTEATVKPSCDHEAKPRKSKTFDLNILQLLNLHQALPTCGLLMYKKNKPLT